LEKVELKAENRALKEKAKQMADNQVQISFSHIFKQIIGTSNF
jgi:hypothetical protein